MTTLHEDGLRSFRSHARAEVGYTALVWPSTVRELKDRLQGSALALNALISKSTCPAPLLAGWMAFFTRWQLFYAKDVPTFGAGGVMDEAQTWEKELQDWNKKFQSDCGVSVPMTPSRPDNMAQDPEAQKRSFWDVFPTKTALVVAGGTVVLLGVVGVAAFKNHPLVKKFA